MNKLYFLLTKGSPASGDAAWYFKRSDYITITEKMAKLIDAITVDVPEESLHMFASVVCNMVLTTQYGNEIAKLDPNNTYVAVTRNPEIAHSNQTYCMHPLIQPIDAYKNVQLYLSTDILDRLDKMSWFDTIGAACLQLLREVI